MNIAGFSPDINKGKVLDEYCQKFVDIFSDRTLLIQKIEDAVKEFKEIVDSWVKLKGKSYYHGVKSNQDFNEFLLKYLHERNSLEIVEPIKNDKKEFRGTVIKVLIDKNNKYCGFISRMPENIFFHFNDNRNIDFSELYAKDVMYRIEKDHKQSIRAVITKVIKR